MLGKKKQKKPDAIRRIKLHPASISSYTFNVNNPGFAPGNRAS